MAFVAIDPDYANVDYKINGLDTNGVEGVRSHPVIFELVGATWADKMTQLKIDIQAYADLFEAVSKANIVSAQPSFVWEPSSYVTPVTAELWQEAVITARLEGLGQKVGSVVIPAPVDAIIDPQGMVLANESIVVDFIEAYQVDGEADSTRATLSDREHVRNSNFIVGGKLRYRSRKGR